jgi:hypothetical protein
MASHWRPQQAIMLTFDNPPPSTRRRVTGRHITTSPQPQHQRRRKWGWDSTRRWVGTPSLDATRLEYLFGPPATGTPLPPPSLETRDGKVFTLTIPVPTTHATVIWGTDWGGEGCGDKNGPNNGLAIVCPVLSIYYYCTITLCFNFLIKWFDPTHKIDMKQVK